jgi:hypothetical protein
MDKEYTIYVTETVTRNITYTVHASNEEEARTQFAIGHIIDSWTDSEDIEDLIIHSIVDTTGDELDLPF